MAQLHYKINNDPTPIRLFKSDFLEFFTHISPIAIIIIWLPIALYFLVSEILAGLGRKDSLWYILAGFLIGMFVWTFAEYNLHRFVFHFRPRNPTQEKIIFLFHGIHHTQPKDKTRLVMPPVVSIPGLAIFYGLFTIIVGGLLRAPQWVHPLMGGFVIGYLCYDLIHYATHHFPMRRGIGNYLMRYHMMHHYKTDNMRFGVSSPLWDFVYGTKPAD